MLECPHGDCRFAKVTRRCSLLHDGTISSSCNSFRDGDTLERMSKRDELATVINSAESDDTSDQTILETYLRRMTDGMRGLHPERDADLIARAGEGIKKLRQRMVDAAVARISQNTTACRSCGSRELLVCESASVQLYLARSSGSIEVMIVVCRTCGDVRMRTDPRTLPGAFTAVRLPGDDAPFRR